ncbi:hypothetical protein CORC01_09497, partial [Colletotrichum orchidophilum]
CTISLVGLLLFNSLRNFKINTLRERYYIFLNFYTD